MGNLLILKGGGEGRKGRKGKEGGRLAGTCASRYCLSFVSKGSCPRGAGLFHASENTLPLLVRVCPNLNIRLRFVSEKEIFPYANYTLIL